MHPVQLLVYSRKRALYWLASSVDLSITAQGLEAGGSGFFQPSWVMFDKFRIPLTL